MILPALLLAIVPPVTSQPTIGFLSAGDLRDRCGANSAASVSYCFAYITGVFDTVKAYESWLNMREFCAPPGIPQGDLRSTFVAYLNDNPGDASGEAASVVVLALKRRYACGPAPGQALPAPARAPRKR